jgi:cytochrome c biogenesis factor
VLSFIVSSSLQLSLPEDREVMGLGDKMTLGGSNVELIGLSTLPWTSAAGNPGEVRVATFTVTAGDDAWTVMVSNHYENGSSGPLLVHGGTTVIAGLMEDVYLSFDWMAPESALVQVRVIPMVSGVWMGSAVLMTGMLLPLAMSRRDGVAVV